MEWCIWGMEVLFLGIGSYYDIKSREIPLWLFWVFGVIGVCTNLILQYQGIAELLFGCLFGLIFLIIGVVTKGELGMADALGFIVLGIFEGGTNVICLIFFAFIISGVYGLCKVLFLKTSIRETLPFFPFLFLALIGGAVI